MIGTGIRKFAQERGMTCDAGMAYGKVNGRHIAMDEGSGYKALRIYLYPPVEQGEAYAERDEQILNALMDCDLKEFRLNRKGAITIQAGYAQLVFQDTMGTMKRIERYIDEIMPKLNALNLDTDRCACCGKPLENDLDYVHLDGNIMPLHAGCVQQLSELVDSVDVESRKGGSLIKGTLGAFVGAVLGAVLWALVFMLGYIAAVAGLLIGWLSSWMYDKFGGKKSKLKVLIVAVAVIIGVFLGQAGGYSLDFAKGFYENGGGTPAECVEYVSYIWEDLFLRDQEESLRLEYREILEELAPTLDEIASGEIMTEAEFVETYYNAEMDTLRLELREEFVRNCALGLFYSLLGCIGLFMKLHRQNKRRKIVNVK